ncbi:MAG: hypothetical protein ACOYN0_05420 [Phycisphaerales bacterium]
MDATRGDAATALGREAQVVELKNLMKKSFLALLGVGILQLMFGSVIYFGMGDELAGRQTGAIVCGIGAIFVGLAIWARSSPLPASIVGLTVYGSILLIGAINNPASAVQGGLVHVIIIGVLARAIQAGLKYKKLSGGTP